MPLEALVELGAGRAECLEDGACDGPVAAPDGLVEIVDGEPLGPTDEDDPDADEEDSAEAAADVVVVARRGQR